MIFMTTLGIALIEQLGQLTDVVRVRATSDILDSIEATLKLTDVEEDNTIVTRIDEEVTMSKGTCVLWMTHELLNYVDYNDFGRELLNLNQTSLAMLYEKLRFEMRNL